MTTQYKQTGVSWIGEIPTDWSLSKLKTLALYCGRGQAPTYSDDENDLIVINQSCITYQGIDFSKVKYDKNSDYLSSKGRLLQNDFLINSTGTGTLGRTCLYTYKTTAICDSHITIFRANSEILSPRILEYFFRYKQDFVVALLSEGATNQIELRRDWLLDMTIPLPPKEEQGQIVDHLDEKVGRVRELVADKERLIELLEEQKQTLIHEAVTRGLDPERPTKPSGILWLGSIPEHWQSRRLKTLTTIIRGASPRPIADPKYFADDGEYAWVRIADVTASNMYLNTTTQKLSDLGSSLSVRRYPGDLFLSIAGSVGKPIFAAIKCCIHDGFVAFDNVSNELDTMYLYHILNSGHAYSGLGKMGTQLNLNIDTVANIAIGLPPLQEQQTIVQHIELETSKIDELIATARREIELVREYEASLIYHVVTGKVRV